MTHEDNTNIYTADEGKLIVRRADGFIMGDALDLGAGDDIANYEEREVTDEERAAFFASIGMEDPKKRGTGNGERATGNGKGD